MISEIRKSFHSNTYKIVLWITILALAGVFSIPELIKDFRTSTWVAKVNSSPIPYADFVLKAQAQEARIQLLRQKYGQFADMFLQSLGIAADPRIFALESLIKESLIMQAAQELGVQVSSAFVGEKLASPLFVQQELSDLVPMFVFDPYSGINTQALRAYLKRIGMSLSDFEDHVDRIIERKVFMDLVGGALYVPSFIAKERYAAEQLAKRYSVLRLSFGDYLTKAKAIPVTDEELKSFYDKNSKRYGMPEQRAGKVWSFDPSSYGVSVDEDAVNAYYNNHKKSEFVATPVQVQVRRILLRAQDEASKQAAYERAQALRAELVANPSLFAKKAEEISEDKETAKQGGLVPFFEKGTKHKAFDKAAFLLQQDQDISDVIITDDGIELLQRVAKKPAEFKPLSAVYKDIEKILLAKKFKEQFARDTKELNLQEQGKAPAIVAKASGKPETINLTSNNQDSQRIKTLFGIAQEGGYGFYVQDTMGYLVMLEKLNRPYQQSFEMAKEQVKADWYHQQAVQNLQKDLAEAKELSKTMSLAELKNKYKGTIEHTGLVKQSDTETVKQLQKRGLPTEKLFVLAKQGATTDAMVDLDGFIVRLEEVEPFKEDEFAKKQNTLQTELQTEYARILAEGFVASLGRNATITMNESLLSTGK